MLGLVLVQFAGTRVFAQPAGGAPPSEPGPAPAAGQALPPPMVLGLRLRQSRNAQFDLATVVVVPDSESYLAAISAWTPTTRFPVLIDDGTRVGREDIARFVRGFGPVRIVRWNKQDAKAVFEPSLAQMQSVVAKVWGAEDSEKAGEPSMIAAWKKVGHVPPGVVVVAAGDTAWTAGVALAAGRGQLLMATSLKGPVDRVASVEEADGICREVEKAAEASGYSWRGVSDELEAVTLCAGVPNRILKGPNDFYALTDKVGRLGDGLQAKDRWAWAGQIFGTPSHAAYLAMCALFVQPRGAWLFDGYEDGPPWNTFSARTAARVLEQAKIPSEVIGPPGNDAARWRGRAARPIDAGLILVNTKGNDDFFDLNKGRGVPGDVPELNVPAIVSMVHSWSATNIGRRDRLAGRWLERGVFCYAGSVSEPYLQAFVPTPNACGRLLSGAPFGASLRLDNAPLWKIGIYGDPLFALGNTGQRRADTPALEGATSIDDGLRDMLTQGDLGRAVQVLLMQGRDDAVAKVAEAVLNDPSQNLTPEAASDCVLPAFRSSRNDLVWKIFARGGSVALHDPTLLDALWLGARPILESRADGALLGLMEQALRPDQAARDAGELGRAIMRVQGLDAARGLFQRVKNSTTDQGLKDAMSRAENAAPESW